MENKDIDITSKANTAEDSNQESAFNIKAMFAMVVLNWQWFALSVFVCLCLALVYLRYKSPVYQVATKILIKDDGNKQPRSGNQMLANMQDLGFISNSNGIDNEVEILHSHILAREAGYRVEQSDVEVRHFIPEHFFAGSLDDFWENVCTLDAEFEKQRKQLAAENKRLRYVARMENGSCSIGLQAVDSRHPFYELEGSNNIIMISTERYHDYPMIIQGYGAGADVTAAGVFADIISIANIR